MKFKSKFIYNPEDGELGSLDGNELFDSANKVIQDIKNQLGWNKLPRHFQLQTLLNRHSAGYLAPTAIKSFNDSPAHYAYGMLEPIDRNRATYFGTVFHQVMEGFYNLEPEERDYEHLIQLRDKFAEKEELEPYGLKQLIGYVDGFWSAPDYLKDENGKIQPMNHKEIKNQLEYFARDSLHPLGINMSEDPDNKDSVPVYTLLDRIDFRDGGAYIIDYKTGWGNADPNLLGVHGYLPQMIYYKWIVETVLNKKVLGVFLMLPGANDEEHKWVKMDVDSLKNQSIVIEQSVNFLKDMSHVRDSRIFPIHKGRYTKPFKFENEEYSESGETKTRKILPIEIDIDEREFLETALEDNRITELPDKIQTLEQWAEFASEKKHLVEEEYILNQENKDIRKQEVLLSKEIDDEEDEEDW